MAGHDLLVRARALVSVACLALLACSQPAATTAPPVKPTEAPAATPAEKPAATAPAAKEAAASTAGWDQIVDAARKEGTLTIATGTGSGPQNFVNRFKEKYPWIKVEQTGFKASDLGPRVISEQRNGLYAWDVQVGTGFNTVASVMVPADAVGNINDLLEGIPADVKDDSKWAGGFALFRDPAHPDSLITSFNVAGGYYVNRDVIPAGELTTFDQLLDPKYKGKIAIYNPTQTTGGSQDLAPFLATRGESFIRGLIDDQKMVIVEAKQQATEWVMTGRYPIGLGMDDEVVQQFQEQGVGKKVEEVRESQSSYLRASGITAFKNPPHANAAKAFTYWFLSQDGQDAYASLLMPTSTTRRTDVPIYHPKDTPDFAKIKDYQVWTGTPAGDAWLNKVVDIVNKK